MLSYSEFVENLEGVREAMANAAAAAGRAPEDIALLPVTKFHPVAVVEYCARAELAAVGENRVQEASEKRGQLSGPIRWELIGHLQSNKAKLAIDTFDRIQSVDSVKLVKRLGKLASKEQPLPLLLQFNTGEDPAKYGFAIDEATAAVDAVLEHASLKLEGLMTIAPLADDASVARQTFARLRQLRDSLEERYRIKLPELSMGMSGDLREAIAEGSTQIRVGTRLFGERHSA